MPDRPEKMFPILHDPIVRAVPWAAIQPHEAQAQRNHSQSLERLAERGGLDVAEAVLIMRDQSWTHVITPISKARMAAYRLALMRDLHQFEVARSGLTSGANHGN